MKSSVTTLWPLDLPQIQLVYPDFSYDEVKVTDTLVLSRLIRANLKADDFDAGYTLEQMPKRLYGSHSLKAWGMRTQPRER